MKKAVVFIVIFIIIGSMTAFIIRERRDEGISPEESMPSLISEENLPLDNWRTYENELGYRIKMPPDILVDTTVGKKSIHLLPDIESGEFGTSNFIYISVISREEIDNNKRVYNYNSGQFLDLMDMEIGEERSLISDDKSTPDLKDWFIYERLEDTNINDNNARVFINRKPWEFPLGVTEIRYVIPTEEKVFIVGGYYGGDISYASLTRSDVEKVISTFKVL